MGRATRAGGMERLIPGRTLRLDICRVRHGRGRHDLTLGSVGVAGPFPKAVGGLSALTHLDVSNNSISGAFPTVLYLCASLQYLDLYENSLTGELPVDIGRRVGKLSFTWFGPTPRVTIPDPELVKEVLSNKFGHFGKPRSICIGRLLANGLVNHDGEKWAKHRRILNPAFHHEKIKGMLPVFSTCCVEMITRSENSMPSEESSEIDV